MKKFIMPAVTILTILFLSVLIISCTGPELQTQISSLQTQLDSANSQVTSLQIQLASAQTQLASANSQVSSLQNQLSSAITPPYIAMKNRQAQWFFYNLDNQIDGYSLDADTLEANVVAGTLMRKLSIPEMNQLGLTSLSQRFTNGSKYINLGGQSNRLDCEPYVEPDNFKTIADDFYSSYPDDASRIKEVWNMVTQLCPYTNETTASTPRLPVETLLFGGGDCKDLAILTASILREMSSSWKVEFVYMDADNPTSYKTINHVSVFVDTGTYKTFVESTEKEIMNPYQSVKGFYENVP